MADFLWTWGVAISIGAVFVVLCFGLYSVFRGGEYSKSYSNKLMRWRVLLQFVAICIMFVAVYFKSQAG